MQISQVGNTYADRRAWSNGYLNAMNMMAAELLQRNNLISPSFTTPTVYEDQRQGIDMYVDFERIKLAYRVRAYEALRFVLNGFTIRTTGNTSELDKIRTGVHADFMLYGIASEADDGTLHAGILVDLKSVAVQLKRYPSILEKATVMTSFVEFSYDDFPEEICVGWYGFTKKEKVH